MENWLPWIAPTEFDLSPFAFEVVEISHEGNVLTVNPRDLPEGLNLARLMWRPVAPARASAI